MEVKQRYLGAMGEHREGALSPGLEVQVGPGWSFKGPETQGTEGAWKNMVKTEAGTSIMTFDTCKHFDMAEVTGTRGGLWVQRRKPGHCSLWVKLRMSVQHPRCARDGWLESRLEPRPAPGGCSESRVR